MDQQKKNNLSSPYIFNDTSLFSHENVNVYTLPVCLPASESYNTKCLCENVWTQ